MSLSKCPLLTCVPHIRYHLIELLGPSFKYMALCGGIQHPNDSSSDAAGEMYTAVATVVRHIPK